MEDAVVLTSKSDLQRVFDDALDQTLPRLLKELSTAQDPAKEYLSNAEAREYLDVSRSTLQRWRDSGLLPYSKLGGSVYYARQDLIRVLDEHRINGASS